MVLACFQPDTWATRHFLESGWISTVSGILFHATQGICDEFPSCQKFLVGRSWNRATSKFPSDSAFFSSLEPALGDKPDICKNAIDTTLMADINCKGTRSFSVGKRGRMPRRLFSSEVSAHRLLPWWIFLLTIASRRVRQEELTSSVSSQSCCLTIGPCGVSTLIVSFGLWL